MDNDENVFFDIQIGEETTKRIVFYLYDDDLPITCKNFRELAKGTYGYGYNGSIFYRVTKGQVAVGGDYIYNTGLGNQSIFTENFKDENFKYKHDRRGILSMVNYGPDTNGSQFFITFVSLPCIDKKYVVFGEVAQETLEVLDWLEEFASELNPGQPLKTIKIINCGTFNQLKKI